MRAARGSTRVHYRDRERPADRRCRGKVVVVACSAIESVRLLMLSAEQSPDFDAPHQPERSARHLLPDPLLRRRVGGDAGPLRQVADGRQRLGDRLLRHRGVHPVDRGSGPGATIYNNTSDQALPIALARTHGASDLDTLWHGFDNDTRWSAIAIATS